LSTDPLADVRAYYDAGARLNAGLPLYLATADTTTTEAYFYPPLLAITFRPLALLPYPMAAAIWGAGMVVAFWLTLRRLGWNRRTTIAVALLGLPIGWALAIGQAQVLVTWLVTLAAPWSVALAANIKVLPAFVALYWLGRRDVRRLAVFGGWLIGLVVLQLVLEPANTLAYIEYLSIDMSRGVNNLSPYALSPQLWWALAAAGGLATLLVARRQYGWAAAATYSVLVSPRLLSYMLMSLLAALATPSDRVTGRSSRGSAGDRDDRR